MVNFPTSPQWIRENPTQYPFSVNLGVFSRKLHTAFPYSSIPDFPGEYLCHWRMGMASLMPDQADPMRGWWGLREVGQFDSLADEVLKLLETVGLPILERLSTEEGLRDHWLAHRNAGVLGDFQGFQYLIVLLRRLGPEAELHRIVGEMRGKWRGTDWEARVEDYLRMQSL